jgi:hypothetical protein
LEKLEGYQQPGTPQEYEELQSDTAKSAPLGSVRVMLRSDSVTLAVQQQIMRMDREGLDPC